MEQEVLSYSLLEMAAKGGWIMIVLAILSLVAIYIFGKKLWLITKASKIDRYFMNDIQDYMHAGKIRSARSLCAQYESPVARMVEKGIDHRSKTLQEVQASMENVGNVEVARLEKGLSGLASIAGGAPMLGFLGTVTGMIRAFFNMANSGNNVDITLLSGGIYEAMITTVGGLIVGIVAYFGYNFLVGRVSSLTAGMDTATMDMIDILETMPEGIEETE
ncbi:MAG: MotA/TolQ/ExbB proton channel family protein [Bacteroidales bacterium]|nr:MotA/TolQ/ExbB proton channel family protein [Candidatus Hennigimonas equi]